MADEKKEKEKLDLKAIKLGRASLRSGGQGRARITGRLKATL